MFLFLAQIAETQMSSPFVVPPAPMADFTWTFVKVILAMTVVCLLAVGVIRYLLPRARFIKNSQSSRIEILERFPLEPKKSLYLLKVGAQEILIGTTEASIQPLLELKDGEKIGYASLHQD